MQLLQELEWLDETGLSQRAAAVSARAASPERDLELALVAIAAGDFDRASQYGESAFGGLPGDAYAAYACGVSRLQRRAWEQSLEALLKVPVDFERASEVAVLCAVALLELERYEEADRIARSVSGVDDETHGTLAGLRGRCALQLGDRQRAGELLDEALRFAPKLEWVRRLRASLPARPADVAAVVI